jgi:endonuclease/exonuclease/phosphatase family metal-dependent hydrolase
MKLKFLTWNISFAYGPGSDGIKHSNLPPYRQLPASHFESGLRSISNLIKDLDIDVAFLQEVDFDSRRSCYMNQLDWISRTSGLNYRLPIVSWDKEYVPYPGLNPKNHFGKVVSGGGVISKFPLTLIQNQLLPKPRENSVLYNYFYLKRYLQLFKVILPGTEINCANLHLEAFSQDNRELHLIRLQDRLQDYDLAISGGDFNGSATLSESCMKKWELNMSPLPSFPQANEILDGWITKKDVIQIEKITTLDTGTISDHLPLLIECHLKA